MRDFIEFDIAEALKDAGWPQYTFRDDGYPMIDGRVNGMWCSFKGDNGPDHLSPIGFHEFINMNKHNIVGPSDYICNQPSFNDILGAIGLIVGFDHRLVLEYAPPSVDYGWNIHESGLALFRITGEERLEFVDRVLGSWFQAAALLWIKLKGFELDDSTYGKPTGSETLVLVTKEEQAGLRMNPINERGVIQWVLIDPVTGETRYKKLTRPQSRVRPIGGVSSPAIVDQDEHGKKR